METDPHPFKGMKIFLGSPEIIQMMAFTQIMPIWTLGISLQDHLKFTDWWGKGQA